MTAGAQRPGGEGAELTDRRWKCYHDEDEPASWDRIDMRIEDDRSGCPRMLSNLRAGRMIETRRDLRNLGHFCVSGGDVEMRSFISRAQPSRMDDPC